MNVALPSSSSSSSFSSSIWLGDSRTRTRTRRSIGRRITKNLQPLAFNLQLLLLLLCLALAPLRAAAQSSPYTPYQHKALYLFNFAKFTEWPKEAFASDDAPFVIGILGTDPFGNDINIIKGKTIKGRKLEIRQCRTAADIAGCQMLFINSTETNLLTEAMAVIGNSSILIIAETDEFIQKRVMIKLVGDKKNSGAMTVGFEINLPVAEQARLKLDTQLLKLAKSVKPNAG